MESTSAVEQHHIQGHTTHTSDHPRIPCKTSATVAHELHEPRHTISGTDWRRRSQPHFSPDSVVEPTDDGALPPLQLLLLRDIVRVEYREGEGEGRGESEIWEG